MSFGATALANGPTNANGNSNGAAHTLLQRGYYYQSHLKNRGAGQDASAAQSPVSQYKRWLNIQGSELRQAPAPQSEAEQFRHWIDSQAKVEAAKGQPPKPRLDQMLRIKAHKAHPSLIRRWGKKIWGFFSFKTVRQVTKIARSWKRKDRQVYVVNP